MKRPTDLPDFKLPPLNEVVLGVQFAPAAGYQQIYAGEIWGLFRSAFPKVQEQPPLAPSYETFGSPKAARINFGIHSGASHDRFWFLSENDEELIQFQQDKLLHNWRKVPGRDNEYPRFETMIKNYESELTQLEEYFSKFSGGLLAINQCEISYINHIAVEDYDSGYPISEWINFINLKGKPGDFGITLRDVIRDDAGKPCARLITEVNSGVTADGKPIIVLSLSVKGAPGDASITTALDFLREGRVKIVNHFADVTTEAAQKIWERIQ